MQLMAELRDNPGYVLILENVQAFVDDLGDLLESAPDDKQDLRRLNHWRTARQMLSILRHTPEQFHQEMNVELARLTDDQRLAQELHRPVDFRSRQHLTQWPPPLKQ
jgi:hypothetical protein